MRWGAGTRLRRPNALREIIHAQSFCSTLTYVRGCYDTLCFQNSWSLIVCTHWPTLAPTLNTNFNMNPFIQFHTTNHLLLGLDVGRNLDLTPRQWECTIRELIMHSNYNEEHLRLIHTERKWKRKQKIFLWCLSFITARNEVGARLYFHRRVWFCSQGGSASVHVGIPPPGAGTPPAQSMLGDTVNARVVRILLECNLVLWSFRLRFHLVWMGP